MLYDNTCFKNKGYHEPKFINRSPGHEETAGKSKDEPSNAIEQRENTFLPRSLWNDLNSNEEEESNVYSEVLETTNDEGETELEKFNLRNYQLIRNKNEDDRNEKVNAGQTELKSPRKKIYYSNDDVRNTETYVAQRAFSYEGETSNFKLGGYTRNACNTPIQHHRDFGLVSNANMPMQMNVSTPSMQEMMGMNIGNAAPMFTNFQAMPSYFVQVLNMSPMVNPYQYFPMPNQATINTCFNISHNVPNINMPPTKSKKKSQLTPLDISTTSSSTPQGHLINPKRNLSMQNISHASTSITCQSSVDNSPKVKSKVSTPKSGVPHKSSNERLGGMIKPKTKSSLFNTERDDDHNSIEGILGSINCDLYEFVKSQKGSRSLQKLLNKIPPEEIDVILDHLKSHLWELMSDTYGNYFCQKFIQCCSAEQRIVILKNIHEKFAEIACNTSGTHALQSLIELINMPEEAELIKKCIEGHVMTLVLDLNGTHVIQKCISCLNEKERTHINDQIFENFDKLIFDSNGICVLKKFANGNEDVNLRLKFINKVSENALEIIQNPFGNYVVQYIIEEWGMKECNGIVNQIVQNVVSLSMQKFSSNVVEKCYDIADEQVLKKMNHELLKTGKISYLLKNKYGNYVLQKAISVMNSEEKQELKEDVTKKLASTSSKDKSRLSALIESL